MENSFIAEFCKRNYPKESEKTIKIADNVCRHVFTFDMPYDLERSSETLSFDGKIKWDYLPENGDLEFLWQFNRHRYFIALGQAYCLTGYDKYADCFCELICDWIDNVPYCEATKDRMWRSLETGLRGEYWSLALRLFDGNERVKGCREKIKRSLKMHAEILKAASDDWLKLSNWGVIQDHGLFDIAVTLDDAELKKLASARLEAQAELQVSDDGVHWEQSPLYHMEILKCFLDVIIRADWCGFSFSDDFINRVYKMAKTSLCWKKPNHHHPLSGDSDDNDIREILTLSAIVFNCGLLKFGAYDIPDFETVWLCGIDGIKKYSEIEKKAPPEINAFFQESGNYILRSDFSETANYLYFKNSFIGSGHGHSDKLNIELCISGEELLTDSGRYTYLPTEERFYLKSPAAHNVPAVDSQDYTVIESGSNGWAYESTALSIRGLTLDGEKHAFLSGGYYHPGKGYIERRILWLKPDIYFISDSFRLEGLHNCYSYYHMPEWGSFTLSGMSAEYKGRNVAATFSIFGSDKVYISVNDTPVSRVYNQKAMRKCCKLESRATDCCTHTVVIAPEKVKITERTLTDHKGNTVPKKQAQAFEIDRGDEIFRIVISCEELVSTLRYNDFLTAGRLTVWQGNRKIVQLW